MCCSPCTDLKVLGGLLPLVACLAEDQPGELQEGAAFVLGTAASNNAQMTAALLEAAPDVLQQLLQVRHPRSAHRLEADAAMH